MNEVTLDLATYEDLKKRLEEAQELIRNLVKSHQEELQTLVNEGKVKIITKMKPFNFHVFIQGDYTTEVEYKGFNDVKSEVEEHFKKGIFKEELEKEKRNQFINLVRTIAEKDTTISDLKENIEIIKNRSLWERIRNNF